MYPASADECRLAVASFQLTVDGNTPSPQHLPTMSAITHANIELVLLASPFAAGRSFLYNGTTQELVPLTRADYTIEYHEGWAYLEPDGDEGDAVWVKDIIGLNAARTADGSLYLQRAGGDTITIDAARVAQEIGYATMALEAHTQGAAAQLKVTRVDFARQLQTMYWQPRDFQDLYSCVLSILGATTNIISGALRCNVEFSVFAKQTCDTTETQAPARVAMTTLDAHPCGHVARYPHEPVIAPSSIGPPHYTWLRSLPAEMDPD